MVKLGCMIRSKNRSRTHELSYRDGIVDDSGKLTPEWRALFERYPDRFLLGSDTWVPERWASYGEIHGRLSRLAGAVASNVAKQIAHGNARSLFADSQ
jgi:hypothetical protein